MPVIPHPSRRPSLLARRQKSLTAAKPGGSRRHPGRLPAGFQFLLLVQHSSSAVTFALVAAALAVYAWTVQAPRQWSREYRKLETLQRHERHLTATNEMLKNQLAQQAEKPGSGLVPPHPNQVLFLSRTPDPPGSQPGPAQGAEVPPQASNTPLAY